MSDDKALYEEMSAALAIADEETRTRLIAEYMASITKSVNQLSIQMHNLEMSTERSFKAIYDLIRRMEDSLLRDKRGYGPSDYNPFVISEDEYKRKWYNGGYEKTL